MTLEASGAKPEWIGVLGLAIPTFFMDSKTTSWAWAGKLLVHVCVGSSWSWGLIAH